MISGAVACRHQNRARSITSVKTLWHATSGQVRQRFFHFMEEWWRDYVKKQICSSKGTCNFSGLGINWYKLRKVIHRGLSVAQNGYGFRVLLGCDLPKWQVPNSALISRMDFKYSKATDLGAAWTLFVSYAIYDHPVNQTEWCLV
jgi:hypothetical protein